MKFIGIDYGQRKIGIAIADSESKLAEPVKVVRFTSEKEALEETSKMAEVLQVSTVVIGISEGETAKRTEAFGSELQKLLNVPVVYFDETLSTFEAQQNSIAAGIKRSKRKKMEDAFAASVMLQNYLDSLV